MNGEASDAEDVFPGSGGAASMVAWIDQLLTDVRDGQREQAREAIESGHWRAELDLSGVPVPIVDQAAHSLYAAADALRDPGGPAEAAIEALLIARARFLPGA